MKIDITEAERELLTLLLSLDAVALGLTVAQQRIRARIKRKLETPQGQTR